MGQLGQRSCPVTPTLMGRWQTRLLLLGTVGVLVTALFAGVAGTPEPFINLLLVLIFGFFWDLLYIFWQSFRWDGDWPPLFQLAEGIFEGVFVFLVNPRHRLPLQELFSTDTAFFFWHYATVWVAVFVMTQGPLRVLFPHWRFRGGRWL